MKALNIKLIPVMIVTFGLAATPAVLAQGCCGGQPSAPHAACDMGAMAGQTTAAGHQSHGGVPVVPANPSSAPRAVFPQPVQSVYDNYSQVHTALAQDSFAGVATMATAMVKAIQGDSAKMLPPKVSQQVEALSKAKDLETARVAFKPLSESLIQYVKDQKDSPSAYHEVYCPMAKASWLQTNKTVMNPYMGKAMIRCGQLKTRVEMSVERNDHFQTPAEFYRLVQHIAA
jgi:Cu(I)/Ag(I) efflux system membrane fusion protein